MIAVLNEAEQTMAYKDIFTFFIVCVLSGGCIFAGSVLGNSQGKTGLFVGAVIGGFTGVGLAVWLSSRLGLFGPSNPAGALIGGWVGFVLAAVIAVNNLHTPFIPLGSIALIGLGALSGKALVRKPPST
jgi:hypothetical protein